MTREEYNLLFHKEQLNLVAFKRLMDCDEEVLRLVNRAIENEREACALIADKSHRIFRDTKDAHDRNSPNSEPFNPNAFGFSVYAIEESLRITLAIRARGQE